MPAKTKKNHRSQKSRSYGKKNHADSVQSGSFRVIGGEWRSRRLNFMALEGLRPTTDRVRETVFNWLMPYLPGARVLDLFAGSGSLGLEALSRDAETLVSVEKNSQAAACLLDNYELLGITRDRGVVENTDALSWLRSYSEQTGMFDVVFLDPPFRKGLLEEVIAVIEEAHVLANGAVIYLEQEKEGIKPSLPNDWVQLKEKVAGQVSYQLFQRQRT